MHEQGQQGVVPEPRADDADSVAWALITAAGMARTGNLPEALRWIRRAVAAATEVGHDARAVDLGREAASLAERLRACSCEDDPAAPTVAGPTSPGTAEPPPSLDTTILERTLPAMRAIDEVTLVSPFAPVDSRPVSTWPSPRASQRFAGEVGHSRGWLERDGSPSFRVALLATPEGDARVVALAEGERVPEGAAQGVLVAASEEDGAILRELLGLPRE